MEPKFAGTCKECSLALDNVAELDCRHPSCPAWADNGLIRVFINPELQPDAAKRRPE